MPASGIDCYIHDARNNFEAVRPAPVPTDTNASMGQNQSIHVSTNCYYGYHNQKNTSITDANTDCEMLEVPGFSGRASPQITARKRSADNADYPQSKRLRPEVQKERTIEPETKETMKSETTEDLMESLYWNIHGGNMFHLVQYDSSMCSLVGTRSSPSHSASAFNVKILSFYIMLMKILFGSIIM